MLSKWPSQIPHSHTDENMNSHDAVSGRPFYLWMSDTVSSPWLLLICARLVMEAGSSWHRLSIPVEIQAAFQQTHYNCGHIQSTIRIRSMYGVSSGHLRFHLLLYLGCCHQKIVSRPKSFCVCSRCHHYMWQQEGHWRIEYRTAS